MIGSRAAATALFVACAASTAAAQTVINFAAGNRADAEQIRISYNLAEPILKRGGYGVAFVEIRNVDQDAHDVRLSAKPFWDGATSITATRSLRLEPGESARVPLPVSFSSMGQRLEVSVDGVAGRAHNSLSNGGGGYYGTPGLNQTRPSTIVYSDDAKFAQTIASALDVRWTSSSPAATASYSGSSTPRPVSRALYADIPEEWMLLSQYDAIVLDLHARGLAAPRQQALVDWIASGGVLVGVRSGSFAIPEGPLRDLLAPAAASGAPSKEGRRGAGRWKVLPDDAKEDLIEAAFGAADEDGGMAGAQRSYSGAPCDGFFAALEIPGLGEIPLRTFLFLIFAYLGGIAIFARRCFSARKTVRLLKVLPIAGVVGAILILTYGVVREGLGIKGSLRSVALLDQRERSAAVFASQALYATFEPSVLAAAPGTLVNSPAILNSTVSGRGSLDWDLDRGCTFDGSLVPARTPTTIVTTFVGRARERLRFRRREDGGLDVLFEESFRPAAGETLLVSDFEGRTFLGPGEGPLARVGAEEGDDALAALVAPHRRPKARPPATEPDRGRLGRMGHISIPYGYEAEQLQQAPESPRQQDRMDAWTRARAAEALRAGGYVALIDRSPLTETFGLRTEWSAATHLVIGRLAEDDIGR